MQPINYMQGYKSAIDSILGQARSFQDLSQNANVLQSQREQNRITTAHNDRRIQAMNALQGVDFNDENALRTWAGRYGDLEYGKGLNEYLGKLDEQTKKAEIGRVSQTLSLIRNGKYTVAIDDLEQQAIAYENAGDKANAQGARQMAQFIRQDPQASIDFLGKTFAMMMGKDGMSAYKDYVDSTAPKANFHDLGNQVMASLINPTTGEMATQNVGFKGQSPDSIANNELERWKTQGGWDNAITVEGMRQDGAMARTQYQSEADLQKERVKQAYEAQKEKHKNSQILFDEDGYAFYYNPADPTAGDYIIDPQGNKVKKSQLANQDPNKHIKEITELKASNDSSVGVLSGLQTALDMNSQIYSGAWADGRADLMGALKLDTETSRKTQEYTNLILNIAMRSMKEIFGGNPTEGEREMLKQLQASANKPPQVRETILRQFMETIRNRVKSNNEQMAMYGGGQYQHKFEDQEQNSRQQAYNNMYGR